MKRALIYLVIVLGTFSVIAQNAWSKKCLDTDRIWSFQEINVDLQMLMLDYDGQVQLIESQELFNPKFNFESAKLQILNDLSASRQKLLTKFLDKYRAWLTKLDKSNGGVPRDKKWCTMQHQLWGNYYRELCAFFNFYKDDLFTGGPSLRYLSATQNKAVTQGFINQEPHHQVAPPKRNFVKHDEIMPNIQKLSKGSVIDNPVRQPKKETKNKAKNKEQTVSPIIKVWQPSDDDLLQKIIHQVKIRHPHWTNGRCKASAKRALQVNHYKRMIYYQAWGIISNGHITVAPLEGKLKKNNFSNTKFSIGKIKVFPKYAPNKQILYFYEAGKRETARIVFSNGYWHKVNKN